MQKRIIALTDYKGHFGSKHFAKPYRSGMDLSLLADELEKRGYKVDFLPFHEVSLKPASSWNGKTVIYTSSEDPNLNYKSYIEDIALWLERAGAIILPPWTHLRANNNKVFMELMLKDFSLQKGKILPSYLFGSVAELNQVIDAIPQPSVIKGAAGSMGKHVMLAHNEKQLLNAARKISGSSGIRLRLKEWLRQIKHKGYKPDSLYRTKFIVQEFVPNLKNDWKVYVMGDALYIFNRPIFKSRSFRASGGGYDNYRYGLEADAPDGLFDFAFKIFRLLDVPMVSLDIGYDEHNKEFMLFEFQSLYFGTAGMLPYYSKHYFKYQNGGWETIENNRPIEETYSDALCQYLNNKQ